MATVLSQIKAVKIIQLLFGERGKKTLWQQLLLCALPKKKKKNRKEKNLLYCNYDLLNKIRAANCLTNYRESQ